MTENVTIGDLDKISLRKLKFIQNELELRLMLVEEELKDRYKKTNEKTVIL